MGFQPNVQQQAVLDWADTGSGSLNLIARAGCGKTASLVLLAQRVKGWAYLGAFNKAIADELGERIGRGTKTTTGTLHSAGLKLWRKIRPYSEIDSRKIYKLVKEMYPYEKNVREMLQDAVSYARQAGFGLTNGLGTGISVGDIGDDWMEKEWTALFDHYDLWDGIPDDYSPERAIASANKVFRKSLSMCADNRAVIDFDDMIFAPLFFSDRKAAMYDWVMIDEAQDTSDARRYLAMSMLKDGGRFVAVGDPAQSIYGFSGARNGSMDLIKTAMGSTELPLSVTYRCPKSVVGEANAYVPDLTAHETAPDGEITSIGYRELWHFLQTKTDPRETAILCRFTRPLLGIAQRLRRMGVPCHVEGNSAKGLLALAMKWGEDIEIRELIVRVDEWAETEAARWNKKGNEEKAEAVYERAYMVKDVASQFEETELVRKVVQRIDNLFSGEGERKGLTLCTIHRSKGREWDQVVWVGGDQYQPAWFAKQEWEKEQERNLAYVAITRAKRELVKVGVRLKQRGSQEADWWEE